MQNSNNTHKWLATFSGPDNCNRLELRRIWDDGLPLLVVCMLNPSTADHRVNDPTIHSLIHFAGFWGYGGIYVVNLFAYRSSSPKAMMAAAYPQGTGNGQAIENALEYASENGGRVLVAWGNDGNHQGRDEWFASRALMAHRLDLICLGRTRSGAPKHPLARGRHRVPRDQQPIVWRRTPL